MLPERAHRFAPKRYTHPHLLACVLVKEYFGLDYRTAQENFEASDGLRKAIGLAVVSDYPTLWRFVHDKATAPIVTSALAETVRRFTAEDRARVLVKLDALDDMLLFMPEAEAERPFVVRCRLACRSGRSGAITLARWRRCSSGTGSVSVEPACVHGLVQLR